MLAVRSIVFSDQLSNPWFYSREIVDFLTTAHGKICDDTDQQVSYSSVCPDLSANRGPGLKFQLFEL
jgi:hypothetical protein